TGIPAPPLPQPASSSAFPVTPRARASRCVTSPATRRPWRSGRTRSTSSKKAGTRSCRPLSNYAPRPRPDGRPARAHPGRTSMTAPFSGTGTSDDPWVLKTPPLSSEYILFRAPEADPPALVCRVGSSELRYHLRCIEDLHAMLKAHGDWMPLGSADEQKPAKEGTVEAWGRSPHNPVGGWYGLKKGMRGR